MNALRAVMNQISVPIQPVNAHQAATLVVQTEEIPPGVTQTVQLDAIVKQSNVKQYLALM